MLHVALHGAAVAALTSAVCGSYAGLLVAAAWAAGMAFSGRREYLDGVSAIQLRAVPSAFVFGIVGLRDRMTLAELRAVVEEHFLRYDRFRTRVRSPWWWWSWWEPDPHFDVGRHLFEHSDAMSHADVERWLEASCSTDIDWSRPPYEFHLLTDTTFEDGARGSTLVIKFHHCVADGVTMLRAIFQAVEHKGAVAAAPSPVQRAGAGGGGGSGSGGAVAKTAVALRKLLLQPSDPESSFKQHREVAGLATPMCVRMHLLRATVAELKDAGKRVGVTINDMLLSAATAAMRRLDEDVARRHHHAGGSPPSLLARAQCVLWVSLRPLSTLLRSVREVPLQWGNQGLGAVYLSLPLGETPPRGAPGAAPAYRQVLESIRAQTAALIGSPEPVLAHALQAAMGLLHPLIGVPIFHAVAYKTSVSLSNMPGPQFPCALAGRRMRHLAFFVPPAGDIGTFVCIFTLDGRVMVSVCSMAGRRAPEDVHRLVHSHFDRELDALLAAVPTSPAEETAPSAAPARA